jgi:glutathione S-transferase
MDWQLTVCAPAIHGLFWGLIRTPPEQRDPAHINASKDKTAAAMRILDAQLGKTAFVAGNTFSMGDIPVGLIAYRYRRLVPERLFDNLERWYAGIEQRPAFKEHVLAIPFV